MLRCHTLRATDVVSRYGLDPDTPTADYDIRLVPSHDPAYIPPDAEAWPLYYRVALDALQAFPGAYDAVRHAVSQLCRQIQGRRALPPRILQRSFSLQDAPAPAR